MSLRTLAQRRSRSASERVGGCMGGFGMALDYHCATSRQGGPTRSLAIRVLTASQSAALIAWTLLVRVDGCVKGLLPPKAAALRAALDATINSNRMLSKRSRP